MHIQCMYMYATYCVNVYMCIHMYAHVCVCIYIRMHMYVTRCTLNPNMDAWWRSVCLYECVCAYVYICIYICIVRLCVSECFV